MFIDHARISIKAGSGGNGCNSIYRDKYIRRGRPDGGDGGDGGNIIIRADRSISTLLDYRYKKHFKAENGRHGGSNHKTGGMGEDLIIRVPIGSVILDAKSGLLLRDLIDDKIEVIICKGGKGGRGNSRYRLAAPGQKGEEKDITLELKLIADIGIIGYPNAGKSTFISKVSSAKSKIAGYPFTTKAPILGIVRHFGDKTLVFADMPGLIEGAHQGKGLGDRFLKHIERTRALIHMVDISSMELKDPFEDYTTIKNELKNYGHDLVKKPRVVALNKVDLPDARGNGESILPNISEKAFFISAITGEGIKDLLDYCFSMIK